jgi:CheY-like chemotaxis protein
MNTRPLTILIVEDMPDGAESMAMMLRLYGFQVLVAHDGQAALTLAQTNPPGVVLLDLGLPGMDGYEVAQRLCGLIQPPPLLVAVTGYGQDKDKERSRQAGFDRHFVKPVDPQELAEYLQQYASVRPPVSD